MVLAARNTNHPSTVGAAADHTCQVVVKGYEVCSVAGSASMAQTGCAGRARYSDD